MTADDLLERGSQALAAGRWGEARDAFAAALDVEESVPALLGLGDALWWLADAPGCVRHMERAYALQRRCGEEAEAVMTAVWLAFIYRKSLGNPAASSGWAARAARLLPDGEDGVLHGWVLLVRAFQASAAEEAVAAGRHALAVARRARDPDLELCALGELGRALVAAGEVEEGLAHVDEAMAGALGGECDSVDSVVAATCSMLLACDLASDLDRVRQWCQVADGFMQTYGCPFLFADCRMRYGSVLLATGHWEDAERELLQALRTAPPGTDYHGQALARLADLRLRQGRLEEAGALLQDGREQPAAWRVVAAVQHARGEHDLAAATLTRLLGADPPADAGTAEALALLVAAHLARGDVEAARTAAQRLEAFETARGSRRVAGHRALSSGQVALAAGAHGEATALLDRAVEEFSRARLPFEAARARLALAEALAPAQPRAAVAEAQGAFATFDRLGARRDADAAAALLRSLGAPARTGPKGVGTLTEREREVLGLLSEGLTNPEIAERLFISRKTASHHVSSILAKLGLRNRAEVAAYATRQAR